MAEAEEAALQFTPTWIVAAVCSIIVLLSLVAERCLHYLGKVYTHARSIPRCLPACAALISSGSPAACPCPAAAEAQEEEPEAALRGAAQGQGRYGAPFLSSFSALLRSLSEIQKLVFFPLPWIRDTLELG